MPVSSGTRNEFTFPLLLFSSSFSSSLFLRSKNIRKGREDEDEDEKEDEKDSLCSVTDRRRHPTIIRVV
jgi:hypothetical protein